MEPRCTKAYQASVPGRSSAEPLRAAVSASRESLAVEDGDGLGSSIHAAVEHHCTMPSAQFRRTGRCPELVGGRGSGSSSKRRTNQQRRNDPSPHTDPLWVFRIGPALMLASVSTCCGTVASAARAASRVAGRRSLAAVGNAGLHRNQQLPTETRRRCFDRKPEVSC